MIKDLRKELDEGKISSEELFDITVKKAKEEQDKYNSFVTIIDKYKIKRRADSILKGIPYALKDNISTSNILTTASSNILKDYVPIYDATVYRKLKNAGAVLVGKTTLDELAMGGTGTTAATGVVKNPWNPDCLIGGSSAGSAAAVALGIVPFAIGSDTGDSIRKPASFGGVVGFKPTYGRISRYGLFAFASSLDHVGVFTRSVEDAAIVTDVVKGYDNYDMTSLKDDGKSYSEELDKPLTHKKLCYIKEICDIKEYKDSEIVETLTKFQKLLDECRNNGFQVDEVSIDRRLLEAIYPVYMIISCAEATSNNANLTGIQFGPRGEGNNIEEIMFSARTKGFSELIKRRFILGSYILQKENQEKLFLNACRVRRLIVDRVNEIFKDYDGIILPASGKGAPSFDKSTEQVTDGQVILENHMAIGNFGGFPSITIPFTFVNDMPVGVNITGRAMEDDIVLHIAKKIESITGLKGLKAGDRNV